MCFICNPYTDYNHIIRTRGRIFDKISNHRIKKYQNYNWLLGHGLKFPNIAKEASLRVSHRRRIINILNIYIHPDLTSIINRYMVY
jgi:hypothetical protein